jgi:hypothetical protein
MSQSCSVTDERTEMNLIVNFGLVRSLLSNKENKDDVQLSQQERALYLFLISFFVLFYASLS